MRKPFFGLLGVVIVFITASCSSPKAIDNLSESSPYHSDAEIERIQTLLPIENEQLEEPLLQDVPSQLKGSVEDEALRVMLSTQLEADQTSYKTDMEFHNKSETSLDLMFDCGLLISNDQFAPDTGDCPAVESMLLKRNKRESRSVTLSGEFFDKSNNVITIRYRQNTATKNLEIKLEATE